MLTVPLCCRSMIWVLAGAVLASATMLGCEADVEEGCLSGPCGPDAQASVESTTSGPGTGGGGGMVEQPPCLDIPDDGDIPCDVMQVLVDNCHCCHQTMPQNGAPFAFVRWEDTQQPYGSMGKKRWERMAEVIEGSPTPFMPLAGNGTLTEDEKNVLRAWFMDGAPPEMRGTCECTVEFKPPAACIVD